MSCHRKKQKRINRKRARARARARACAKQTRVEPVRLEASDNSAHTPSSPPAQTVTETARNGDVVHVLDRRALVPGLDPDDPVVDAILEYVLARACTRFGVDAIQFNHMKGRIRLVALARLGNIAAFARYFFWLTALKLNRLAARKGRFWCRGRIVGLSELGDTASQQVACALDPVQHGAVAKACWQAGNLRRRTTNKVSRPAVFGRTTRLPEHAEVVYLPLQA